MVKSATHVITPGFGVRPGAKPRKAAVVNITMRVTIILPLAWSSLGIKKDEELIRTSKNMGLWASYKGVHEGEESLCTHFFQRHQQAVVNG